MPFVILLLTIVLAACSGNSAVSSKLSGSDSLIINFYATGSTAIEKTVATTEPAAIRRLTEFISANNTELFKCGYDGNLLFFENGKQVSDVSFKFTDPSCRHFLLDVKGELVSTKMSNQAADFLSDLRRQ